jgi:hypothetical protein
MTAMRHFNVVPVPVSRGRGMIQRISHGFSHGGRIVGARATVQPVVTAADRGPRMARTRARKSRVSVEIAPLRASVEKLGYKVIPAPTE